MTLNAADFAAMPATLREDLFAYLTTRREGLPPDAARRRREVESNKFTGLSVLDASQAIALVRNVSFDQELRCLHDLLEALSYERDADAPGPDHLVRLLKVDGSRHLRRFFDGLKRLLKPVTADTAPLARYYRGTGTYMVHPITRASLREVFAQLARSGEGEEPLWA